jgi:hypothetical protein
MGSAGDDVEKREKCKLAQLYGKQYEVSLKN